MTTITKITVSRSIRFQIRQYESAELSIYVEGAIDPEEFPHEAHAHLAVMADDMLADQFYDFIIGSARAWDKESPLTSPDAMTRNIRTMSAWQNLLKINPDTAEQVLTDAAQVVASRIEADEIRRVQMEAERIMQEKAALEARRAEIAERNGDLAALEALEDFDSDDDDDDDDDGDYPF